MRGSIMLAAALAAHPVGAAAPFEVQPLSNGDRPLAAWLPGTVRCDGAVVSPVTMRRPLTRLGWSGPTPQTASLTVSFDVDQAGRPLSIRRVSPDYGAYSEDVLPSLAASRFPAGEPRAKCQITYTQRMTAMADTPVEDLVSYSLYRPDGDLPWSGWNRIFTMNGDCADRPLPPPLVQVYPDFRKIPATPGSRDWSMVTYDQNARGRTRNVRTLYSTGNTALDAASVKAMRASRHSGGARAGCVYPYWRGPRRLEAPPSPDTMSLRPATSNCDASDDRYVTQPRLIYPDAYGKRSIEGWAIVAFDVAPWGELGNLRVLASQPTEDFGKQALQVLRSARKAPSQTGHVGCVDKIVFRMGPADEEAAAS
ncbi:TonB family protein [uncultured Sphingomonas sp.]|uniref:TonB family protein n=1 Tax=uncultured Sphingomonas sp. TaxID=158754 RepID=UPI0026396255|nr:TonB family protein [uncultured Sphingomonas sp.]